jgi:chemotaxis protein CheX
MTDSLAAAGVGVPPAIIAAVQASVDRLQSTFFHEKPLPTPCRREVDNGPCIAGIISFLGDVSWSLAWILPRNVAPALVEKMAGFEIPFDSPDMGDAAGELINVFAGEVAFQLDQRGIKAQISLPTVVRGSPLELLPGSGPSVVHLQFTLPEGPFWFRLATTNNHPVRPPAEDCSCSADQLAVLGS